MVKTSPLTWLSAKKS